jgi:hypothetical protein
MYEYPNKRESLFNQFQKTYNNATATNKTQRQTKAKSTGAYSMVTDGKTMLFTPNSSWLDMVIYNHKTKVATFLQKNGKPLAYKNVPSGAFKMYTQSVEGGSSAGTLYNHTIKNAYPYVR